jgi:hypothetical protein
MASAPLASPEDNMGKTITVTFETDVPEPQLEEIRNKIRLILRGEAVPEAEVVGQWHPDRHAPEKFGVGKRL